MTDEHNPMANHSELERLRELLPTYGMGMADEAERALVQSLLIKYPEEAAVLDDYEALSDAMLHSAPPLAPPPELLGKIMQTAAEIDPADKTAPARPTVTMLPKPGGGARGRWSPPINRALVAAVAALVVLNALALVQVLDLRADQDKLREQASVQTAMLSMLARDDVVRFAMQDMRAEDSATRREFGDADGTIICNPQERVGVFYAKNLPPLKSDQAYQLWLIKDGQRVSGGLLKPNPDGTATYVFAAPEPMGNYHYAGITTEPASGSAEPTGDPVVRGGLYPPDAGPLDWEG